MQIILTDLAMLMPGIPMAAAMALLMRKLNRH